MTYTDWIVTRPICPTCGMLLTATEASFKYSMKKHGRPPIYHNGHNPHHKPRQYQAEYEAFIATKSLCACGCGEILQPGYQAFVASMVDYGRGPIRKQNHHKNRGAYKNNQKKVPDVFIRHGCKLVITKHPCRCKKFATCEHYADCLGFITMEKKSNGWKTI